MFAPRIRYLVGFSVVAALWFTPAGGQTVISNPLFSVSLPADLKAETNNRDTILASGSRGIQGPPFLIIYFCTLKPNKKDITACDESSRPLSTEDARKTLQGIWDGKVTTRNLKGGVIEWSACATSQVEDLRSVNCIWRLSSATGYIDMRYVSSMPLDKVHQSMENLVSSIDWH